MSIPKVLSCEVTVSILFRESDLHTLKDNGGNILIPDSYLAGLEQNTPLLPPGGPANLCPHQVLDSNDLT
jgi:hypothetical protein